MRVLDFVMPEGMETAEICPVSGKLRTDKCPPGRSEVFAAGTAPTEPCDVHSDLRICTVSGQRAGEFCPQNVVVTQYFETYPLEYRTWAEMQGKAQPPAETCRVHTRAPAVEISQPREGGLVEGMVPVYGSAYIDDFDHYEVQYGIGDNPLGWGQVARRDVALENAVLGAWDTRLLDNGLYSLRVVVFDRRGNAAASPAVRVRVVNPTPTATQTPTTTATPTQTPTPTTTPTVTATPEATPTATATPQPSGTPVPSPMLPEPTATPSPEPTAGPPTTPEPTPTQD